MAWDEGSQGWRLIGAGFVLSAIGVLGLLVGYQFSSHSVDSRAQDQQEQVTSNGDRISDLQREVAANRSRIAQLVGELHAHNLTVPPPPRTTTTSTSSTTTSTTSPRPTTTTRCAVAVQGLCRVP